MLRPRGRRRRKFRPSSNAGSSISERRQPEAGPTHEGRTAERIALNDATFRAANEQIRERATMYGIRGPIPFICECAREDCTELVQLWTDEYETVRSQPEWFFNAPGHDSAGGPWVTVVEAHDRYVIVEKLGRAAEIAREEA